MNGEQLYNITKEIAGDNAIVWFEWGELGASTKAQWEQMADEQNLKDQAKSARLPGDRKDEDA